MNKNIYNFSAGPTPLPKSVLEKASIALNNWNNTGCSVIELHHRSDDFFWILDTVQRLLKKVFTLPDNYTALLLHGGARQQYPLIPLNLAAKNSSADYLITGHWSQQAATAAQNYCLVNQMSRGAASSSYAVVQDSWQFNPLASYVHYCPNETIDGVQFNYVPVTHNVPLIADMTSCLAISEFDLNDFGMVYASCQKNLGIAGLCLVFIDNKLLERSPTDIAAIFSYSQQRKNNSLYNTPNTFAWYILQLILEWTVSQGGVKELAQVNRSCAHKLYKVIDNSSIYVNNVAVNNRSSINIPFNIKPYKLEKMFLEQASALGLINLTGHNSVGGIRVSLYNAVVTTQAVDKLLNFMVDFEHDSMKKFYK